MTHHPFGPDELDRDDRELDEVAHRLERYADETGGEIPAGLRGRIHAAIDAEPEPARGWWQRLIAGPAAWAPAMRAVIGAGAAAVVVLAAVVAGGLLRDLRPPDVGGSQSPSPVVSPTELPSATPSPTPSATPTPTRTPTPSVSPSATPSPSGPEPTASDDDDDDDPDDDDDASETPEPDESDDSSGPGGGGGDD